jgi:hypothetical protein
MNTQSTASQLETWSARLNAFRDAGKSIILANSSVESILLCEGALTAAGFSQKLAYRRMVTVTDREDTRPRPTEIPGNADIYVITHYLNGVCEVIFFAEGLFAGETVHWTADPADQANAWANAYLSAIEDVDMQCVSEGMTGEEWDKHADFIAECWKGGIKPTHFLDVLHQHQKDFNKMYESDADV